MVKIKLDVAEIMENPRLTIKTLPWSDQPFIARLGFEKGKVPKHLEGHLIKKGECEGKTGFVVYKGKRIPAVAACVARLHAKKK